MKHYAVKLSDKALIRINGLYDYIAKELLSPDYAFKQYERMMNAILGLEQFPERCPILSVEPWRGRKIRKLLVDNYSIFYIILAETVIITDVLYSKSDIERRLSDK